MQNRPLLPPLLLKRQQIQRFHSNQNDHKRRPSIEPISTFTVDRTVRTRTGRHERLCAIIQRIQGSSSHFIPERKDSSSYTFRFMLRNRYDLIAIRKNCRFKEMIISIRNHYCTYQVMETVMCTSRDACLSRSSSAH
jgi:hypothetical protein